MTIHFVVHRVFTLFFVVVILALEMLYTILKMSRFFIFLMYNSNHIIVGYILSSSWFLLISPIGCISRLQIKLLMLTLSNSCSIFRHYSWIRQIKIWLRIRNQIRWILFVSIGYLWNIFGSGVTRACSATPQYFMTPPPPLAFFSFWKIPRNFL